MNTQELAEKTADLTDQSVAEIHDLLDLMDVDQIINLTAAVQDEDAHTIQQILDGVTDTHAESEADSMPEIKAELQQQGRKKLKAGEDLTQLWPLIGKLTAEDWKMIWPSLDEEILQQLYQEATQKTTDRISAADAQMLHDYSISFIAESMVIYENEWWQVQVPQAPDNLVGICQHDHLIWVPRHQLQPLTEHVMGMTQMPSLVRMKELAGIQGHAGATSTPHMVPVSSHNLGSDGAWLQDLRMHMREIEQLMQAPKSEDTQEEIQLHMKALSRKARDASHRISGAT